MRVNKMIGIILLCLFVFRNDVNAQVNCLEPDGQSGYYKTAPEITIKHTEEKIMRYRLEDSKGKVLTGRLDSMMRSVTIQKGVLKDGENVLDIWMEDENGKILEDSMKRFKYLVDQTAPVYPLIFTKGDVLQISAEDEISGVAGIYYALDGEETQYLKGNNVYLELPKVYEGKISAYAVDNAGNEGELSYFEIKNINKDEVIFSEPTEPVEVKDKEKPIISLSGIPDVGISNESVSIICAVTDNMKIVELKGIVKQRMIDGTEVSSEIEEWKKTEKGYQFQRELIEDGIYQIEINGQDEAGNISKTNWQVIVDTEAPKILKIDKFEGKRMQEFTWNFQIDEIVTDLTDWNSEIRLDGILYREGQVCRIPGMHVVEIIARDLAGNESKKSVTFYIDEPEIEDNNEETDYVEESEEDILFVKQEDVAEQENEIRQEDVMKEPTLLPFIFGGTALMGVLVLSIILIKMQDRSKNS